MKEVLVVSCNICKDPVDENLFKSKIRIMIINGKEYELCGFCVEKIYSLYSFLKDEVGLDLKVEKSGMIIEGNIKKLMIDK